MGRLAIVARATREVDGCDLKDATIPLESFLLLFFVE
jgi:hypothetical protein